MSIQVEDYVRALREGRSLDEPKGLLGRVARGKSEADFRLLSFTAGRRLAWVSGPDALLAMLGRSHTDIILQMGKSRQWLADRLAEGMTWRLMVFPGETGILADWEGVFRALEMHYPETWPKISRWASELEATSFEAAVGAVDFDAQAAKSPEHPSHMGVSAYVAAEDTLRNARLFLWHALGLNPYFSGSGRTTTEDGKPGELEYLYPNVPTDEIPGLAMVELQPSV